MNARVTKYLEDAERLRDIIPTFDPANGDMILVIRTEDAYGGHSFRLSPELGAQFRSYIFQAIREKAN
ncbi:hypothetical protein EN817_03765 [Mesorhizobium sp. M3A.F.Ca.ET.174.01.1.1]|uniref:hypothetical protein n=1 Tax=unclassified Mesorhizobium TaxID=325217 RepID=UPI000FE51ACA|nr:MULTISPECIES: hypothetical protein [unclassified Mesorhizobium]RWE30753.1 MAG: hypothetical protein EOS77_18935 [Mesorhizobium sp.]TGS89468.1 hypothetical protein EN818_03765 [Mesorhizobium sp. M3A.F.Ca.ET.175.01.1.1]TGT31241.1 hypothetical protein EN817_03765 [Mesorhizobium sp. M3A.F.Ca.ET.174.01.1.1]